MISIDEIVATGHLKWCDEKYAPGVAPTEVSEAPKTEEITNNTSDVASEEAPKETTSEEKEFKLDDNLIEMPKEDNKEE